MMERRSHRRKLTASFIPKLYLCCAVVVASGGPHLAHGGGEDAHGGRNEDSDDNGTPTVQGRPNRHRHRHRWMPDKPHANDKYGYDALVIDPISMFGSPLGGFSRDVSSRLASLPLRLPSLSQELPPDNPTYLKIRDGQGQLYACRVYHQDELDSASRDDGLFELPKLAEVTVATGASAASTTTTSASASAGESPGDASSTVTRDDNDEDIKAKAGTGITLRDRPDDEEEEGEGGDIPSSSVGDDAGDEQQTRDLSRKVELAEVGLDGEVSTQEAGEANPLQVAAARSANVMTMEDDNEEVDGKVAGNDDALKEGGGAAVALATYTKDDVEERLAALEGVCAHIHLGWWSTEWSVQWFRMLGRWS